MPRYIVTTPLYAERAYVETGDYLNDGQYVDNQTRDVAVVVARNRSTAKAAAVRAFKRDRSGYFGTVSANPFAGLTARRYDGPMEDCYDNVG